MIMEKIVVTNYIVTLMPDQTFSVWHEGLNEPYRTVLKPRECNCPHWLFRLRHQRGECKHHKIVKEKLMKGGVL